MLLIFGGIFDGRDAKAATKAELFVLYLLFFALTMKDRVLDFSVMSQPFAKNKKFSGKSQRTSEIQFHQNDNINNVLLTTAFAWKILQAKSRPIKQPYKKPKKNKS